MQLQCTEHTEGLDECGGSHVQPSGRFSHASRHSTTTLPSSRTLPSRSQGCSKRERLNQISRVHSLLIHRVPTSVPPCGLFEHPCHRLLSICGSVYCGIQSAPRLSITC